MSFQMFTPEKLKKVVDEALPAPTSDLEGTKALVTTLDSRGARVAVVFKCRQTPEQKFRWDFEVAAEHQWRGDDAAGARVVLQWK